MYNISFKHIVARHKLLGAVIITGILAISQAACGGPLSVSAKSSPATIAPTSASPATMVMTATEDASPASQLTPDQVVTVSMTNFAFQFTPTQVTAGVVKFVVQNNASDLVHEFFLVKTELPVGKLPLGTDGVSIDEGSPQLTKVGSVEDIGAGKGGEMTVKLTQGHYVYFCNTTGHYKLGMAGEITIPAQGATMLMSSVPMTGGIGMTTTMDTPSEVVSVNMTDFKFQLAPTTIKAGTVKFAVKNDSSSLIHEIFVVKTDLAVDKLPMKADGSAIDEESTQFTSLGSVEDVAAGSTGEMIVKLDPGRYVYFCNTPGHYKSGMAGEFTVTP